MSMHHHRVSAGSEIINTENELFDEGQSAAQAYRPWMEGRPRISATRYG